MSILKFLPVKGICIAYVAVSQQNNLLILQSFHPGISIFIIGNSKSFCKFTL